MAEKPSLDQLLKGIDHAKLSQICTDQHLSQIARQITEWESIAPDFELDSCDEAEIVKKYPKNLKAQNLAMLRRWRKKRGDKATYKRLAKVFWKVDRTDLVVKLCKILSHECSSSESEGESEQCCVGGSGSQRWTVPRYADYLKGRYRTTRPHVLSHKLLPPPTRTVFNLALIQKERLEFGPNEELVRLLQRGQVKEAAESHTEIELSNLMRADDEERKVILIEGAPGSGKSTLAWHICQQWGKGELFTEYEVVVFVQLRDLGLQSARTVAEILPTVHADMARDIAALLASSRRCGERVLFVLDGWDELQPDCPLHSLLMQLIEEPTCLNMHFSSLIITSRPVTSGELQCYASSRVEVLGFKPEEVQEYFKACFRGDHQLYTRFVAQLREHPVLEASCFLPLNAMIIFVTFRASNYSLPHTLHGVFEKLVLSCIVRHVTDRGEAKDGIAASCLSDLPPDIEVPLSALSSLAFHGIRVNKAVFSETDLKVFNLPTDLSSTLSLVQVVDSFDVCRRSKSYNFFHLQIQELLAAFHISKLEEDEQVRIFKDLFGQPRFAAVFQFYAAFTKLQAEGIKEVLVDMIKEERHETVLQCIYEAQDPSLCQFIGWTLHTLAQKASEDSFLFLSSKSNPLYIIALGYFLCCFCFYCSEELSISTSQLDIVNFRLLVREFLQQQSHLTIAPLQHCISGSLAFHLNLSVGQYWDTFVQCANELVSSLHPFVTGLVLHLSDETIFQKLSKDVRPLCRLVENASSLQYFEIIFSGRLSKISIDDPAPIFEHYIHRTEQVHSFKVQDFSQSGMESIEEPNVLTLVHSICNKKQLHSFSVEGANVLISPTALKTVCSVMATNSSIKYLTLNSCHFDLTGPAGPLLCAIPLSEQLKVIDLAGTSLGGCVSPLLMALASNTSVVELILQNCKVGLTGENGQALSNMLRTNTTLRALNLWGVRNVVHVDGKEESTRSVDLQTICVGLTSNTSLAYLDLRVCKLTATAESGRALTDMLRTNTTLKSLKLDYNDGISNEGAVYLAQGLAQNRGLETLSIVECGISTAVVELAEALKTNKCLLSLDISCNDDVGERFVHIVRSLQVNSTLRDLRAWDCGIAQTAIVDIVRSSLKSLDLSWNPIGDEGAEHIAQLVTNSRSLYQLNLGGCGIRDRGVECLASALEGNNSLEILHISGERFTDTAQNKFTDTGLLALGRSLKRNKALKTLNVAECATPDGKKQFVLSLCENEHLTYLRLSYGDEVSDELNKVNQTRQDKNRNSLSTFYW